MIDGMSVSGAAGYLCFEFTGEFSVSAGKACIDTILEECTGRQCRRALFDCRKMLGEMSVMDRFAVVTHAAKTVGLLEKVALLGREDQRLPDNFVENVAINRAIPLRVFTDEAGAIAWLQHGNSTP